MSHSHHDSSSLSSSSSSSTGDMADMSHLMTFTTSTTGTALYSTHWTPNSLPAYVGTCIFLILLAVVFRVLIAGKTLLEHRWRDRAAQRRYVHVAGSSSFDADQDDADDVEQIDTAEKGASGIPLAARGSQRRATGESDPRFGTLIGPRGVEEQVRLISNATNRPIPAWRLSEDIPRAAYVTLLSGVAYLIMLAVMTLNLGYFLSVLGGVFLGELTVGRYTNHEEH